MLEAEILRVDRMPGQHGYASLDLALITTCRLLVSEYIVEHQEDDANGISLREAILISYPDLPTIEEYCKEYVNRLGEDAQGPLVQMGLLLRTLSCHGITVFLDRRQEWS
jgi:hypothetical protein